MDQAPSSEANSRSADSGTSRTLWDLNVHYRVQKNFFPNSFLNQTNPEICVRAFFSKIHFNIIFPF
jgi:hypothetical protein